MLRFRIVTVCLVGAQRVEGGRHPPIEEGLLKPGTLGARLLIWPPLDGAGSNSRTSAGRLSGSQMACG